MGGKEGVGTGIGMGKDCFKIIIVKQNEPKEKKPTDNIYKFTNVSVVRSVIRICNGQIYWD